MNKIIIDGKEYELSAELVEKIKAEVAAQEKREADRLAEQDPFARVKRKPYFLINGVGKVSTLAEGATNTDDELYSIANYCHDRGMMEQRALHETLNRLLWRYSEEHGGENAWDCEAAAGHQQQRQQHQKQLHRVDDVASRRCHRGAEQKNRLLDELHL